MNEQGNAVHEVLWLTKGGLQVAQGTHFLSVLVTPQGVAGTTNSEGIQAGMALAMLACALELVYAVLVEVMRGPAGGSLALVNPIGPSGGRNGAALHLPGDPKRR